MKRSMGRWDNILQKYNKKNDGDKTVIDTEEHPIIFDDVEDTNPDASVEGQIEDEPAVPETDTEEPGESFVEEPEFAVDVPEIETEVHDLPEGDENEKEMVVTHPKQNDLAKQVENEEPINSYPELQGGFFPDQEFDESQVIDPDNEEYETSVSEEEVMNTPEGGEEKEEEVSTEQPTQPEEPTEPEKTEPEETDKAPEKEKKGSTYERYPTWLAATDTALGAVEDFAGKAGAAAKEIGSKGTSGTSINEEVARAVPHFDYRSLFR